ncbi:MALE DISCOVERER1 [Hibiscus trionum]|uniref:MALE DISCOVERER1 n=1 Tax=Hibiscus trionum TaxID=183268 RepID=A0A9W7H846_HIBTR|nr:MALE DISCOVERER1 [Hibiscus trionum]
MGGKRNSIGFYFLSLLLLVQSFIIQESLAITTDGSALLEFRARIASDPYGSFANWNSNDTTPCLWFGVHCVDGKAQMLDLSSLDLKGTLAPELGKLSNLRSLVLYKNRFSGVIPKEFGELTKLELLDLRENNLSGTIPTEIGNMLSLKCLLLYGNKFEGNIPSDTGRLKLLPKLQLDGTIASIFATGIGCANRKFGLCIWQSSGRQLNAAGSLFIPIIGALTRYLNALSIQWFKLRKDYLAERNDGGCSDVHGLSEQQMEMARNIRNLVIPLERRRLLVQSRDLPAAPSTAVPSAEQIIVLPSSKSSGSFPAMPKGTKNNSKPQTSDGEPEKSSSSWDRWKYLLIIPCVVVFLVFWALAFMFRKKAAKSIRPWKTGISGQLQKAFVTGVPKLNRPELDVACEDFSNIVMVVDGCTVYKGTLSSGVEIAVLAVCVSSSEEWSRNLEMTFRRKVDRLSRINHKNFVNLIGYCVDDEPFSRMMVFEYAPSGTLYEHLHDEYMEHLDWSARMRIMMGVAYCLLYMHHDLNPPMSHPKLSSTTILLTDDYAAKVVDILGFEGLIKSKNSGDDESEHSVGHLVVPETNVYSFGILLLEIISGKFAYTKEQGHIEEWAAQYLIDKESLSNLVDPTLQSFKTEELEAICEVIQECIQPEPRRRPTMDDVSTKLKEAVNIAPNQAAPRLSPLWWAELEILSLEAA